MTPQERVLAVLAGRPVDRAPYSLSLPLALQHLEGSALAEAAGSFADQFEVDLVKLERCHGYPRETGLSLDRPADLATLESVHGRTGSWGRQIDALRRLARSCFRRRVLVDTVPSPWTLLCELATPELVDKARVEHPGFLRKGLEVLAANLASYARCVLEAGAQGICLEVTGASHEVMSVADYQEWGWEYDRRVLAAAGEGVCNLVQFRCNRSHHKLPADLPIQLVSWSVRRGPGVTRAPGGWEGAVMAGLDVDRLRRLTPVGLRAYLREVFESLRGLRSRGVVLAPGEPLPWSLPCDRLEELARTLCGERRPAAP